MFSLSGSDNLKKYLSRAVLPPMTPGRGAPDMPTPGHKAHRNHIPARPERYRARFVKILSRQVSGVFDTAVLEFAATLPSLPLGQPNHDDKTGVAFTVAAQGFNIGQPLLLRPSDLLEVSIWVKTLPFQTMSRAMHLVFPLTQNWGVTLIDSQTGESEPSLWSTLVWHNFPPIPDPEKPWIQVDDPLETCSVVFVVQPPWIMSSQDFKSFIRCKELPAVSVRSTGRPYTCAQRVWAKLWDTCVRRQCHRWVICSYGDWVFGTFSQGFTAGQILDHKAHDACVPTVVECLVYHVAASMGYVKGAKLPQYRESTTDLRWNRKLPPPSRIRGVTFPDSGSEWDGMDDEMDLSAGVSTMGSVAVSAWGSENGHYINEPGSTDPRFLRLRQEPALALREKVEMWGQDITITDSPPCEREPTPARSEAGYSNASIYEAARRGPNRLPVIHLKQDYPVSIGGFLTTVMEQGPVEEDY